MIHSESHKIEIRSLVAFCRAQDSTLEIAGNLAGSVTGIALDSREIVSGQVFVALKGKNSDGRDFIPQAVAAGAAVVIADRVDNKFQDQCLVILSQSPEKLCAKLAAWLSTQHPRQQVLVTGTNGKTSIAEYTRQIWQALGVPAASIGTLGVRGSTRIRGCGGTTSPDSVSLAWGLATLGDEGIDHVSIEASSHGLVQCRLDGTVPKVGIFSGLGRDHLDYHGDLATYLAAKMRLFDELLPDDACVLYALAHEGSDTVRDICRRRGLQYQSYGIESGDICARGLVRSIDGLSFEVCDGVHRMNVSLPLIGDFQCLNVLAAYGAVVAQGIPSVQVMRALSNIQPVAGRMQKAGITPKGARVFVDYAHTPDALAAVLVDVRKHFSGRLWLGFGCGGERDAGKRAVMGHISEAADEIVVCDDNPRSEEPGKIRQQILSGIQAKSAREIGDRGAAIAFLCRNAGAGDVVLIAGKGHEQGQVQGMSIRAFDDVAEAQKHCVSGDDDVLV